MQLLSSNDFSLAGNSLIVKTGRIDHLLHTWELVVGLKRTSAQKQTNKLPLLIVGSVLPLPQDSGSGEEGVRSLQARLSVCLSFLQAYTL